MLSKMDVQHDNKPYGYATWLISEEAIIEAKGDRLLFDIDICAPCLGIDYEREHIEKMVQVYDIVFEPAKYSKYFRTAAKLVSYFDYNDRISKVRVVNYSPLKGQIFTQEGDKHPIDVALDAICDRERALIKLWSEWAIKRLLRYPPAFDSIKSTFLDQFNVHPADLVLIYDIDTFIWLANGIGVKAKDFVNANKRINNYKLRYQTKGSFQRFKSNKTKHSDGNYGHDLIKVEGDRVFLSEYANEMISNILRYWKNWLLWIPKYTFRYKTWLEYRLEK